MFVLSIEKNKNKLNEKKLIQFFNPNIIRNKQLCIQHRSFYFWIRFADFSLPKR